MLLFQRSCKQFLNYKITLFNIRTIVLNCCCCFYILIYLCDNIIEYSAIRYLKCFIRFLCCNWCFHNVFVLLKDWKNTNLWPAYIDYQAIPRIHHPNFSVLLCDTSIMIKCLYLVSMCSSYSPLLNDHYRLIRF